MLRSSIKLRFSVMIHDVRVLNPYSSPRGAPARLKVFHFLGSFRGLVSVEGTIETYP